MLVRDLITKLNECDPGATVCAGIFGGRISHYMAPVQGVRETLATSKTTTQVNSAVPTKYLEMAKTGPIKLVVIE